MDLPDRLLDAAITTPQATMGDTGLDALIARLIERDEHALALLYDATLARVWPVVLHFTQDWALAEQVVEDIYWEAWREAPRFDPQRASPLAWLLAIARSRATDAQRRCTAGNSEGRAIEMTAAAAVSQSPELVALMHGTQRLHVALARLKAPERELLVLAFLRGLPHHEIALKTALSPGAVQSRIRRTLLTLRRWLDETGAPGGVAA